MSNHPEQKSSFPIKNEPSAELVQELSTCVETENFNMALIALLQKMLEETEWQGHFKDVKTFERLPQIGRIPLICKGTECDYASVCPILLELKTRENEVEVLKEMVGKPCRVDRKDCIELFGELIRELDVKPENTVDILTLTSLVRYQILKRRMDWVLEKYGLVIEVVDAINQKNGDVHKTIANNPILRESDAIQKQISSLLSQLNASREAKFKIEMQNKAHDKSLDQMFNNLKKKKLGNIIDVEATFVEEDFDDELDEELEDLPE